MMMTFSAPPVQQIVILGATGSIGRHSLDVVQRHPDRFRIYALVARQEVDTLFRQAVTFKPRIIILEQETAAEQLREYLKEASLNIPVISGRQAIIDVVAEAEVTTVVSAITGAAGLHPTLAALKAGKKILLANKESMVMAGALIMKLLRNYQGKLLPIDSEHNAIFQVLPPNYQNDPIKAGIHRVCLTASGGALRHVPVADLPNVTPEMALKHPNWAMGTKVTIDSATMMNKGLELIEASWLFNLSPTLLEVVIHPQSLIHSMVEYLDGSQLVQMGHADMRVPIAQALGHPERIESGVPSLDWKTIGELTFVAVDDQRYPCLSLARSAMESGGTAPAILNGANEIAVEAFLNGQIRFTDIASAVDATLQKMEVKPVEDLTSIEAADTLARNVCRSWISTWQERH